jgi:hypothetical protein
MILRAGKFRQAASGLLQRLYHAASVVIGRLAACSYFHSKRNVGRCSMSQNLCSA